MVARVGRGGCRGGSDWGAAPSNGSFVRQAQCRQGKERLEKKAKAQAADGRARGRGRQELASGQWHGNEGATVQSSTMNRPDVLLSHHDGASFGVGAVGKDS
jgi:hypothetical protein